MNGSLYVVSDTPSSLPSMESIVVTAGNAFSKIEVISSEDARRIMGPHGALCVFLYKLERKYG